MSAKRKRSQSPDSSSQNDGTASIYRSEEINDRQSTFIGLYSPSLTPTQLQKLEEISSAGHKILGWRRESNQQSLTSAKKYVTGHDDDGEKYGGKKVEQCLINANVTGACVVARWYGGVMLGPVRFTHMETCALGAIQKWRDSVAADAAKKQKFRDDTQEKARLVEVLTARDQSIVVLRKLASEKEAKLKSLSEEVGSHEENVVPATTPSKVTTPAYGALDVPKLQAFEKARDATLAFLLKRIDKAEQSLKEHEKVHNAVE